MKRNTSSFLYRSLLKLFWPFRSAKIAAYRRVVREQNDLSKFEMLNKLTETKGITADPLCDKEVVVSLTSHGHRIHTAYLAIESIMQQTMLPNKIVLWLSEDVRNNIPLSLKRLERRGLTIAYTRDIGPYTKLIPSLYQYPDTIIITVDDDMLYRHDTIERLVNSYKAYPTAISCIRGAKILIDKKNKMPKSYLKWDWDAKPDHPDLSILATGSSGALYPPHCFHDEVFDEEKFLSLCPTEDDVWYKVMEIKKGTKTTIIDVGSDPFFYQTQIDSVQDIALWRNNVYGGQSDKQIRALWEHYNLCDSFSSNSAPEDQVNS